MDVSALENRNVGGARLPEQPSFQWSGALLAHDFAMSEPACNVCKILLDRVAMAMSTHSQAIARFGEAVATDPAANFESLETEVNAARIARQKAKDHYELHVATHKKVVTSGPPINRHAIVR